MADFYQTGVIATFHRFGNIDLKRMESELTEFSRHRPIALVLPSTHAELEAPAIKQIMKEIKEVPYLNEIVVTMGRTNQKQFTKAKEFFSSFPQKTRIIWNTGPCIEELHKLLGENGLLSAKIAKVDLVGPHMDTFYLKKRVKLLLCTIATLSITHENFLEDYVILLRHLI